MTICARFIRVTEDLFLGFLLWEIESRKRYVRNLWIISKT